MKFKKYLFWSVSFVFSLASCWLFHKSIHELFTDYDYVKSLNLPPTGDTVFIPIAGGIIAASFAAIFHVVLHMVFLLDFTLKKNFKTILSFKISLRNNKLQSITLVICYLICAYWIYDYLGLLRIKIFPYNTAFLLVAMFTTLFYGWWVINIFTKRKKA